MYQVCELIHGQTLAEVIASQGALAPERVEMILAQLLWSLKEAHGHGILHRDLKPPNVMVYDHLGQRDRVKLLDFGIAKALLDEALSRDAITREGLVVGTPRYMAPEQLHGEALSASTDLYALGVFAYEMLTGRHPLDEPGVSRADLHAGRVKLSDHGVALPEALVALVEAMMQPRPEQRPAQCEDVLRELGHALQHVPTASGQRAPGVTLFDVDPRGGTTGTQLANATGMTTSELIASRPPEEAAAAADPHPYRGRRRPRRPRGRIQSGAPMRRSGARSRSCCWCAWAPRPRRCGGAARSEGAFEPAPTPPEVEAPPLEHACSRAERRAPCSGARGELRAQSAR